MNVNNATSISINYSPEFFDSDFRFGLRQTISFQCWDSDITNNSGVAASIADIKLIANKLDFENWSVNGINISQAQLKSFSIESGEWVAGIKYNFELLTYLEGTVEDNLTGSYFAGLGFDGKSKCLLDFSESFNFDLGENSMGYNHSVSYKFSKSLNSVDSQGNSGIEIAKKLANQCLKGQRPPFGFSDPVLDQMYQTYGTSCTRFFTEVYDYVNNTASFVEKFTGLNEDGKDYLASRNTSLSLRDEGVIDVTENGTLDFKCDQSWEQMESHTDDEIELARDRMQEVLEEYKAIIKSAFDAIDCDVKDLVLDDDGKPALITKSRTYNTFTRKSNYSVTATNDEEEGAVRHEYRNILSSDQDWLTSTEDGEIIGNDKRIELDGDTKIYPAYNKAYTFFKTMQGANDVETRLKALINNMSPHNGVTQTPSPKYTQDSTTYSKVKGRISYSTSYSSHPRYSKNGEGIKYMDTTISEQTPFDRKVVEDVVESVNIIKGEGQGGQILQSQKGKTLMSKTNDMRMLGERDVSLDTMMSTALEVIEPGENYLAQAKYNFSDLNDINFSINFSWN